MKAAASQFNRNIFTQNTLWNNPDKMDRLVFVVTVVCGVIGLILPWGASL